MLIPTKKNFRLSSYNFRAFKVGVKGLAHKKNGNTTQKKNLLAPV